VTADTAHAAHKRLLEALDEKAELRRENAKLRAGVTLIAIELDKMKLTDISEALRKVLAAASEGQP